MSVSTGIDELDELLGGGFIPGSISLIAGNPGSGKTTFAAQFIYRNALVHGYPGIYVGFTEDKVSFYRHMSSFGFDFKALEEKKLFKYLFIPISARRISANVLIDSILSSIREIKAKCIAIDSITSVLQSLDAVSARAFFNSLINVVLRPLGLTAVIVADLPIGVETVGYGFEEFLVDNIFILKLEEKGGLTHRIIEFRKVREKPVPRICYEFVIGRNGIRLYLPYAFGLKGSYTFERVSTGIPDLDKMLNGGFLKGSIVLLTGPTGTGKTVIAMMFALTGAVKGEKVTYISFEESAEQLANLIKSLGYDYEAVKDRLLITSPSPRLFTPGALYNYVEDLIVSTGASRIVIDGMSALSRQYSEEEYLELTRSLAHLIKTRGVTAVFTSLADFSLGEVVGISTAADAVIALWFDMEDGVIKRKISVIKARGSSHDRRVRELVFEKGRILIR